ncbi:glycine zipper domain-containing protein [Labrys neptuniae]
MMKLLGVALAAGLAFNLAACSSDNPGDRAVGGALLGGTAGALIGGATSKHSGRGALVGGAIGAAGGAVVGAATTPRQAPPPDYEGSGGGQCAQYGYDSYGNTVCRAYY